MVERSRIGSRVVAEGGEVGSAVEQPAAEGGREVLAVGLEGRRGKCHAQ